MKTYYFVGGPIDGHADAFRRRLLAIGGPPPGWQVYLLARLGRIQPQAAEFDAVAQAVGAFVRGPHGRTVHVSSARARHS